MTDIGLSAVFSFFKIDGVIEEIIKSLLLLILGMLGHASLALVIASTILKAC